MKFINATLLATLLTTLLFSSGAAFAHGDEEHAKKSRPVNSEQKDWGIAGEAKAVNRTVEFKMLDTLRFDPSTLTVTRGDTLKFVIKNNGATPHEFVIGTKRENEAHAALMVKFPRMEHDEPYMAHVAAGKTGEIIWTFNKSGEFDFACLIAGHYQAGMVGKITVLAAK